MSFRRSVLVAVLTAGLAFPGAALAQSAGDNQYQDPFAGSSSGKSGGKTRPSSSGTGSSSSPNLSSQPPVDPSLTTPPSLNAANTTAAPQTSSRASLPNTGVDARLLLGSGVALLLLGLGLRLRTADDRRF